MLKVYNQPYPLEEPIEKRENLAWNSKRYTTEDPLTDNLWYSLLNCDLLLSQQSEFQGKIIGGSGKILGARAE